MSLQEQFQQEFPGGFFLTMDKAALQAYLQQLNWLAADEQILALEKPGEGNMNFVLRLSTSHTTYILKQARPWVEKFPQIAAPVDRLTVETKFYQSVNGMRQLVGFVPKVLGFDPFSNLLLMEDLGPSADFLHLYKGGKLSKEDGLSLIRHLALLHQHPAPADFPSNLGMRQLNHEHIFNYPYLEENGFNLDTIQPSLQEIAIPYKRDGILKEKIRLMGEVYLGAGMTLLHGDYYPGSWLQTSGGLRMIDPEFGFVGRAEFDLAVFLAHMIMSQQPKDMIVIWRDVYKAPADFDAAYLAAFCGIEIMRRLIGLAQLPLELSLQEKAELLARAKKAILGGNMDESFWA